MDYSVCALLAISAAGLNLVSVFLVNPVAFSNFAVTPDGNHLVVGDYVDTVFFFNTMSGSIDYAISGIPTCPIVGLSGDGSIAVAVSLTNPATLNQIDLATYTVLQLSRLLGIRLACPQT